MKSQINILRQLQELVLTRDEHHQTGDGSHMDALNDAIDALKAKLDPNLANLYNRLYQRNHIVISAMTNGCCSVCGMQVPIAQGQQVRIAEHLVACSSCGRILFSVDDDAARNITPRADKDEIKVGISRFTARELMLVDLGACSREEAITKLAQAMESGRFIQNADNLVTAALEREIVLSTAMPGGFAFPHVRGVEGGGLTMAVGVSREGIDWDGETINIVFLSAIPVAASMFYMRLMSGIAQAFDKEANRQAMLAAKDQLTLWKTLCRATRPYVK